MSLKKLRFESFLLSPQEKLPAFVSEWGKCRDVNCVGTAHAVIDLSVSLFASVCGLDIDFRVGRLDWCLCCLVSPFFILSELHSKFQILVHEAFGWVLHLYFFCKIFVSCLTI